MPEFIEFVKASGTVILPLAAIILSIAAMCVSLVSILSKYTLFLQVQQ